jgi:hypothetical protein
MQVYNAIVLRNLPECRGEDVDYSFYPGDKVILTIEDNGVMWINEIGHNPATSIEVDEDDVGYFKSDNLFELLERRVNYDLQHDLDEVDKYLNDLASVIKSHRTTVKLTRDKLNKITDDEVTVIKDKLDSAFNLTWFTENNELNCIQFKTSFKSINLRIYHFHDNRKFILYINSMSDIDDEIGNTIDSCVSTDLDEVINHISTFFLRLKDSVNYLEVNNAAIHTIAD